MTENELDLLFSALSSQPRRVLLDAIRRAPGQNVQALESLVPMSRVAVLKHLTVLEAAGLVSSKKSGRERLLWFNPVPIQFVHEIWTEQYQRYFSSTLIELKRRVEAQVVESKETL